MIHAYNFPDPVTAHDAMCEQLVWGDTPGKDLDTVQGTEVGLHNVAIHCNTIDYNYNLKNLWIPPTRWPMMVRQYLDPGALEDCLAKVEDRMNPSRGGNKGRGIAVLRTKLVQGKGVGRGVRRRWGSCMLSLSFRRYPAPVVTLHSRTTYFGYLAMVDITVAQAFARECATRARIKLEAVQFVWYLELAQFHGFRSLAWMLGDKETRDLMKHDVLDRFSLSPRLVAGNQVGYRKALDGYARILKSDQADVLYGDESFSSFARVRRRFHVEVYGTDYAAQFEGGTRRPSGVKPFPPLPDLWTNTLDFSPLNNRAGDSDWFEEDDEDEE